LPQASSTKLKIGIALQVSIPPLQATVTGFKQGLASCGFIEGQNVTYDLKDGQNDVPSLLAIGLKFHDEKVDMIFAVGTNALIQMYQSNKDTTTPIIFAAITDPYKALPDVIKSATDHGQITGSQAFPPVDQGFQMLKLFLPSAKKIGVVTNTKEANSKAVVDAIQAQAKTLGYDVDVKGINAEADVLAASQALASDKVDVYIAQTDTTVSNAFESMSNTALQNKIPILALDSNYGSRGAEVSLGLNYTASGVDGAKAAAQIIGGAKVTDVAIVRLQPVSVAINTKAADTIGITIPDAIVSQATQKYTDITAPKK
jgi:putative ABC transport system substrate-binding protein